MWYHVKVVKCSLSFVGSFCPGRRKALTLNMLSIGDTIVHNRYGAGTVVGLKTVQLYGETREYVCIELSANRGTLMVQPDEVDREEVRQTLQDMSLIREVFANAPEVLPDSHRSRQPTLQAKLRSNDPRQIAEVLRDLMYRDQTSGLTETDKRIRDKALSKLVAELKLSENIDEATQKLNRIMEKALEQHIEGLDAAV
jgi:RNA polymerase-interacting CarD/CdnL/TRCF family regulator